MIFQALVRRQRYLLTLVAIALSILYSLPVVASSFWSLRADDFSPLTRVLITQQTPSTAPEKVSLFQQLNLSSEQQQQIKQIHRRYRQKTLKNKQRIAKLQQQLSDMMVGTEPVALLRAKNQELNRLRQEMGTLHFESMLATREILTLQQRQKFRELVNSSSPSQ